MKSSTNQTKKTVTAYEQKPGEATGYALVVKRYDGTVITRALLDPVPVPAPPPPPPPSPVPVASVTVTVAPTAINVGETAKVTVTTKDIAGNVLAGRAWTASVSAGIATFDAATSTLTGKGAGTATVTVTSEGVTGTATLAVTAVVVPTPPPSSTLAELPRSTPTVVTQLGGTTRKVTTAGDLQAAINAAQPGDTVAIAAGLTCPPITLPEPAGTIVGPPIEIRTDIPRTAASAPDRRMTPTKAASLKLAKIVTGTSDPAVRTLSTDNPTRGWLLSDLEVTGTLAKTSVQYGLVRLGDGGWTGGGETQTTLARVPRGFWLDRVYIHGNDQLNCTRAVALNSAATAITSSWVSEIHAIGFDSQAVCGWNGPGPYLIENNYLEAAGENVMFGGADPGIVDLIPADITIHRNHFAKPLSWKGGPWSVKNLFELKSARRILVEANVFEHSWPASQEGMAIVIKSSTGGQDVVAGTTDLTFVWNRITDAAVGLNLLAIDCSGQPCSKVIPVSRVLVAHNEFTGIGAEGRAALMLLLGAIQDITVDSNVFTHATTGRGTAITFDYGDGGAKRLVFTSNVMTVGNPDNGGVIYSGGYYGTRALTKMAGTTWEFTGNTMVGGSSIASLFPTGNTFPAAVPAVDSSEITRRTAGVVVAG